MLNMMHAPDLNFQMQCGTIHQETAQARPRDTLTQEN